MVGHYDAGTHLVGRGTRFALAALLAVTVLVPEGVRQSVHAQGTPVGPYTVSTFAIGFASEFCCPPLGPIGLAFSGSGDLYVTDYPAGQLFKFDHLGGVADASHLVVSNLGTGAAGLAFTKDGMLYLAEQWNHQVVRLDPSTGITLPIGRQLDSPTGLAVDPATGDLFTDAAGVVYEISNLSANAQATVTPYVTLGVDGITFAPDGTLYAAGSGHIFRIGGTQAADRAQVTKLADVAFADGIALVAPAPGQPITQLAVNTNWGDIDLVDFSLSPATVTQIVTNGTRGDFVAVGSDQCLYATQTDEVEKVTAADGSCPFLPTGVAQPSTRYVALGDSYSSGEGTYNYYSSTDTKADFCHRSPDAYPVLLASGAAGVNVSSNLTFVACSGAPVSALYSRFGSSDPNSAGEDPQLDAICKPNPYVPPVAGEAAAATTPCTDNSVSLVTLTLGGDDLGFKNVLTACVTNRSDQDRCLGQDPYVTLGGSVPEQDSGCAAPCVADGTDPTYPGAEQIEERLRQAYTDIRGRAPHARIVVLGYPRIFQDNGADSGSCHLAKSDEVWLNQKAAEVDNVIRFAVNASGVAEYADAYKAVNGHEACQGDLSLTIPWINGLVLTPAHPTCFARIFSDPECFESFHPTPDGYKAFAQVVAGQVGKTAPGTCGVGCTWFVKQAGTATGFTVNVPSNTAAASFATNWTGGGDVAMSLTTPSGQVINRQTNFIHFKHGNGDGYEYYSAPQDDPTQLTPGSSTVLIEPGDWTITLSATTATNVTFKLAVAAPRDPTPAAAFTASVYVFSTGGPFSETLGVVVFDAKPSFDPDGDIDSFIWDFRDGTTGSGAHVEHTYHGSGKYCPLLEVIDESGQTGFAGGKVLVDSTDHGDCV